MNQVPPRFPGLRQPESIILDTYMRSHAPQNADWEFNVPVGHAPEPPANLPLNLHDMARKNAQRKVDAIMTVGLAKTIIEVKERAQLGAIGQLLGYAHLYQEQHPGETQPDLLLLTARLSPGVKAVAEKNGITVLVVSADFSSITGSV